MVSPVRGIWSRMCKGCVQASMSGATARPMGTVEGRFRSGAFGHAAHACAILSLCCRKRGARPTRLFDHHMHSTHSPDARASLDELCESAIQCDLAGVCFTEHVDFDPSDAAYGYINYEEYLSDVDRCRDKYGDRLEIKAGIEVTYQSEYVDDIRRFLEAHQFDYVLGSVHLIDHTFIGSPAYFVGKSEAEACGPYWRETMAMLESGLFTRIGHLDYIRTRWPREYGLPGLARWRRSMTDILQLVIESGAIIEVNTSAIRRQLGGPYPNWETLELYRRLGGTRVFMGSDAHNAPNVGQYFPEVAARLEQTGLVICSGCEVLC